jgi:hypothetical protein
MADQTLTDQKIQSSLQLVKQLALADAPLMAAYWELSGSPSTWVLYLVPKSAADERTLVDRASAIMIESPYRSAFSLSDVVVDKGQIDRARALGNYVRIPRDIGKRFDTTFTGGQYFEGVIVIFIAPEFARQHSAA